MDDEMLVCPYDEAHIIHPLRMPRHLHKCRKNHPSVEMAVCPFNGFHEVHPQELRYHMAHCPDKVLLDKEFEIYTLLSDTGDGHQRKRQKGYTELPKQPNNKIYNSDDECWEPDEDERQVPWQAGSRSRRNEDKNSLRLPKRDGLVAQLAHGPPFSRGNSKPSCSNQNWRGITTDSELPVEQNGFFKSQSKYCSHLLSDTETDTDFESSNLHMSFTRGATANNQENACTNYVFSPPSRIQGERTPPSVKTSKLDHSGFTSNCNSNLQALSTAECHSDAKAVCPDDPLKFVSASNDKNSQSNGHSKQTIDSKQALHNLARGRALKLLSATTSTERRPGSASINLSQNGRRPCSTSEDISQVSSKTFGMSSLAGHTQSSNLAARILGRGRGLIHAQNTPTCKRNT